MLNEQLTPFEWLIALVLATSIVVFVWFVIAVLG